MTNNSDNRDRFDPAEDSQEARQIITRVQNISREIARLEDELENSFSALEKHLQNYLHQSNLLAGFDEFQQTITRLKTVRDVIQTWFDFVKNRVEFDHAFIYLKFSSDTLKSNLITPNLAEVPRYNDFLAREGCREKLSAKIAKTSRAILVEDVAQANPEGIPWHILKAKSVIIYSLTVQNLPFGFGALIRKEDALTPGDLKIVNLGLGVFSLLLFQHFYFFQLKRKYASLLKKVESEKYWEFCEKSPLYIYNLDLHGTIQYANPAALHRGSVSREKITGEKFENLLPEECRDPFNKGNYRGPAGLDYLQGHPRACKGRSRNGGCVDERGRA